MSADSKCEACSAGYGIELDRCHGYNHANAAIERVRTLHAPIPHPYPEALQLCTHCGNEVDGSWFYPCPTIKALDGEQE
jgi:hypothetical protein